MPQRTRNSIRVDDADVLAKREARLPLVEVAHASDVPGSALEDHASVDNGSKQPRVPSDGASLVDEEDVNLFVWIGI